MTPISVSLRIAAAALHGIGVTLPRRLSEAADLLAQQHNVLVLAADELDAQSDSTAESKTLTPTEIEADKNAAEGREGAFGWKIEGEIQRTLITQEIDAIRQALRDINAGVPAACSVQVRALTDKIVGILGRQVERDGKMVTLPPVSFHPDDQAVADNAVVGYDVAGRSSAPARWRPLAEDTLSRVAIELGMDPDEPHDQQEYADKIRGLRSVAECSPRSDAAHKKITVDEAAWVIRATLGAVRSPDLAEYTRKDLAAKCGLMEVIITEHPQPRVDPLIYHRILDEVATTLGRERTEAMRAELPPRS